MISRRKTRVQRHIGTFQYAGKSIPFFFWSHLQDEAPDTVIFLGTGQTGRVAQWAAQAAPTGVVVAEGAPHWHAHPSGQDLYDFMYEYTRTAFEAVLEEFDAPSLHIIAQSQAAPGAVQLGNQHPDLVDNVVLVAPLGFAASVFGDTPEARIRTLTRRAVRTFLQLTQSPLHDPRNLYVGLMLLRAVLAETERGASKTKYALGLAYDMSADCQALTKRQQAKGRILTMLLGDKDKIFTAKEIQDHIKDAGINGTQILVIPGISHLSLAVRGGKKVLRVATDVAREHSKTILRQA